MKANTIKPMIKKPLIKPLTLAITLLVGMAATNALAEDAMESTDYNAAQETYTNDWRTPESAEFARLDTTGNGLLLPNEASKGNAFNKKSFAKADADHDGYIDEKEYVYYKTGKWPEVAQSTNTDANPQNLTLNEEAVEMAAAEPQASSSTTSKRSVGVVIDDSIITTKAKAQILATKELKTLQIHVETRQGDVMLSGIVDNEAAKMKAEEVVSKIEGVKSVTNGLEVRS